MIRPASLARPAVLLALALTGPALAQPVCDAPTAHEWLRAGPTVPAGPVLDTALVRPVTGDLPDAVALLADRPAVPLGWQEVARFVPGVFPGRPFRPYLVRAVFPTPNPQVSVRWVGMDLHVAARGLGCAPFVAHPLVVFLNRAPGQVFVAASAAL